VAVSVHFNGLTPQEAEVLALIAEECGEVVQAIGKILRHGLESRHPNGGPTNREALEAEIGNVLAAATLAHVANVVRLPVIDSAKAIKLSTVRRYLHHFDAKVQP